MLDYLVTSKARRRLLTLLWGERASGSVSALAARAHVAFASAHQELHAMKLLGLVSTAREGAAEVFRANEDSPFAEALRELVKTAALKAPAVEDAHAVRTRGELRTLGAPLFDDPVEVLDVEAALVRATVLAHRDPTVARVLPLCFRGAAALGLDARRLLRLSRESGEKQTVGFFLDLTGVLSGESRFKRWAQAFRDRRHVSLSSFFAETSPAARVAAERNTPPVARRWGLRMNMGLDAFKSTYDKHVHA